MCNGCENMFEATQIVNMVLNLHKSNKESNVLLLMYARPQDIVLYCYPYDCEATDTHEHKFWKKRSKIYSLTTTG